MSEQDFATKFKISKNILKNSIAPKRYEHSLKVVELAEQLAKHYELCLESCLIAALLHDCSREILIENSIDFANKNNIKIDRVERLQPVLLHAKIGRLLANKKYAVSDNEILLAIKQHTTAAKNMSRLAMAIYIADMLEETRDFSGVKQLREQIGQISLEQLMLECLKVNFNYLFKTKLLIHPKSVKAYNSIRATL